MSQLLFDQNISYRIVKILKEDFINSKHVSNCGLLDKEDPDIWEYAKNNNYVIVTFDSDFYEISLINGHPPKIIWVRFGNLSTKELANIILKHKTAINSFIKTSGVAFLELLE